MNEIDKKVESAPDKDGGENTAAPISPEQIDPKPEVEKTGLGPNEIDHAQKSSLRSRLIVAGILIAVAVPSIFFGGWVYFAFVTFFLAIAVHEMTRAPRTRYSWLVYAFTYLLIFSFVYWFLVKDNFSHLLDLKESGNESQFVFTLENFFSNLDISMIGIAVALGVYFWISIADKNFGLNDLAYMFTMSVLLGLSFQSFFFLRYYPFYMLSTSKLPFAGQIWAGYLGSDFVAQPIFRYLTSSFLLLFVLCGTVMNDTFAYFVGLFFGKHHMNRRVSPHKTWEGFFGGWFFGAAFAIAWGLFVAAIGYPMLPTLTLDSWYWIVALGVLIPLFGDLGDFAFSLVKRHFLVKDYGTILPGHGGVLDRVDSISFACVGTSIILIFITNGWNFLVKL